MRVVHAMCLILTFALPAIVQQDRYVRLRGPDGEFDIENITKFVGERLEGGKIHVDGSPVQVFWRDKGLAISCATIDGETATDSTHGAYYLKSATIAGDATATWDTDAVYSYAAQQAADEGKPVPPPVPFRKRMTITSPAFSYVGEFDQGTLTLPSAFTGSWAHHGSEIVGKSDQKQMRVFDDTGEVHGTSGTFDVYTSAVGPIPLKKGSVSGPVTFRFARNSTLDGKAEAPTVATGQADRMEFDFIGDTHTITLTGNISIDMTADVKVQKQAKPFLASIKGAKAVLTLGPNGELQKIDMDGTPTITNIKPLKTGGGR